MNKKLVKQIIAFAQLVVTLGLSDAFFFNFILEDVKDHVSALVFAYILGQLLKTIVTGRRYGYNYIYFLGITGVLLIYFSSYQLDEVMVSMVQFGIVTSFMAVPIIDIFKKETPN